MTQTQEQRLRLALDMYRIRLEQARVDLAGYLRNLKKRLDKDARTLNAENRKKLYEQGEVLDEIALLLLTEEPELGFDDSAFFFDLFEGKESIYG